MKNVICFILIALFLVACSKEDAEESGPKLYYVKGKVEKGPFVSGSKITVQELDASLNPTGRTFTGSILDDEGNFDLGDLNLNTPYALLSADGYYFNEVEGELSDGMISLQAVADLSNSATVNVNLLTHLKKERMMQLMRNENTSYSVANKQVQEEALSCFGLQRYAAKDAGTYSIASGTEEAGALIVVSSVLLHDKTDAEFTEYLAKLCNEFKGKGSFTDETKNALWEKSMCLDLEEISEHIILRYQSLGKEVSVVDLAYFIDWDKDGIAGNEPGAGGERELSFEQNSFAIPAEGGTFTIKVNATIPFTLTPLLIDPDTDQLTGLFLTSDISFTKTIQDGNLLLTVKPASGALMKNSSVTIYSFDNKITATLNISQDGDPSKQIQLHQEAASGIAALMCRSAASFCNLDAYYTCSYDAQGDWAWTDFYNHTVTANTSMINELYKQVYKLISFRSLFTGSTNHREMKAVTSQLLAIQFLPCAIWWGNVPYSKGDMVNDSVKQFQPEAFFSLFEEDLMYCSTYLKNELQSLNTADGLFFPSRNVSKGVLASMYMYTNKYQQAFSLLQEIIESGTYSLSSSREAALKKGSKELIYGWPINRDFSASPNILKEYDYVPALTYTEVFLNAAECAHKLGRTEEALRYLNQVRESRNLPLTTADLLMTGIHSTWKSELKGFGSYFAFLKRNELAVQELRIENFRLLLPFPQEQIDRYSDLIQNPGY